MFAGAIDACERLFMQQTDHAVLARDLLHEFHRQLVVVGGDIGGGEDRRKFMLRRGDLVVLSLGQNAELPEFLVQILHECSHARLDGAEIMIVQFLSLRRLRAKERPAGVEKILTLVIKRLVDQEIFLLRADRCTHGLDGGVAEQLQNAQALLVDSLHGTQQRRFFVERLAAVGTECGRDIEHMILDERERGRIPCRVAPRFKRGAQAAGGEAGRIRLALDEFLAGKLHNHAAVCGRRNERVMLFRRDAGHGLEPVGKMRCAEFDSPVLHGIGHDVSRSQIEPLALMNGSINVLEYLFRQLLLHD